MAVGLCGVLTGAQLVAVRLAWTLTWSDDRAFSCAALLMLVAGLVVGHRYSLARKLSLAEWGVATCTWTLLVPWILTGSAICLRAVPISMLSAESSRLCVGLILAIPVWFIAGMLWWGMVDSVFRSGARNQESILALGMAVGLAGMSCLAGPWLGIWIPIVAAVVCLFAGKMMASPGVTLPGAVETPPGDDGRIASTRELVATALSIVALGGIVAIHCRLLSVLIPESFPIACLEWMGLAVGVSLGLWKRIPLARGWFLLIPAVSSALLIALLPEVVAILLWATASLTWVSLVMLVRAAVIVVVLGPIGFAAAGILRVACGRQDKLTATIGEWSAVLMALGFVVAQSEFEAMGPLRVLAVSTLILVAGGCIHLIGGRKQRMSWGRVAGVAVCSLTGICLPLWSSHYQPAQIGKQLFSSASFVAYRAGWNDRLLPVLDDARVVDVREGSRGPLTLWRSHGLQLHLRENGIPRAIVSASPGVHPQFAPEVLQAVFPLLLVEQPRDILVLGASAGVPLTTCLEFPVRRVTCVESEIPLIRMIRGPIAQESSYDPFADDRVRLVTAPPALALMSCSQTYDAILSSPPLSSIAAGGAMFTVDYYRNASRCLSPGGMFCQRFECLDYGPQPLRTTIHSMQQAFRQVMAIETGAGELLLLGTNMPDGVIPADFVARLEAPHIRDLMAHCGLDWCTLLNFPAWDPAALSEISAESRGRANTHGNGLLALQSPFDLMRWGPKLQEVQSVLTALRTTPASFQVDDPTNPDGIAKYVSRKSRLLEWLNSEEVSPELLRRLSEVATQSKLVQENPDAHWWQYRKELRQQLQQRPRSAVQQVGLTRQAPLHPEDEKRKDYFVALGVAAREPTSQHIQAIEELLQPYDPLVSYFAHQEIADLQSRGNVDPAAELANRLHVIYYAPVVDASTRNVTAAIELLVRNPDAVPDPNRRFDILNGLVQTLRSRWEARQGQVLKTPRRQMSDVDRSIVAVDKAVQAMEVLYRDVPIPEDEWQARKHVIDRMLSRPLHTYRSQLQASVQRSQAGTQAALRGKEPSEAPGNGSASPAGASK